jgi:stage III sporulation protein AG
VIEEWSRNLGDSEEKKGGWGKWARYALAVAICLGLLALIWPSGKSSPSADTRIVAGGVNSVETTRANLTRELEAILSQIDGAGQVKVSLHLSSGGVKYYAQNSKNETRQTQEIDKSNGQRNITEENSSSDIAVSAGSPLLVEDKAPQVLGVLVVADGASDPQVKENLTNAVITCCDIPAHQVRVIAREAVNK